MSNGRGRIFGPHGEAAGGETVKININLEELPTIKCPGAVGQGRKRHPCGSTVFIPAVELRVAPGLMTGIGQPTIIQIPVFVCTNCKRVIRDVADVEPKPAIPPADPQEKKAGNGKV